MSHQSFNPFDQGFEAVSRQSRLKFHLQSSGQFCDVLTLAIKAETLSQFKGPEILLDHKSCVQMPGLFLESHNKLFILIAVYIADLGVLYL